MAEKNPSTARRTALATAVILLGAAAAAGLLLGNGGARVLPNRTTDKPSEYRTLGPEETADITAVVAEAGYTPEASTPVVAQQDAADPSKVIVSGAFADPGEPASSRAPIRYIELRREGDGWRVVTAKPLP